MMFAAYDPLTGRIAQTMFGPEADCVDAANAMGLQCIGVEQGVSDATHRISDGTAVAFPEAPGPFYAWDWSAQAWVSTRTVATARADKNRQINQWRETANESFPHAGKWFAADPMSWKDVTGIQGHVAEYGELPAWFPGAWKAVDNTYLPIADVTAWQAFYAAALLRGAMNFGRSEALKSYLDAEGRTMAEVDAIAWDMDIPANP